MANTPSAEKRHRQSLAKRARNRARLSRLRTEIKKVRAAVETGDLDTAQQLLPPTLSLIDRVASKGSIHPNSAARRKSRLVKLVREAEPS